MRIIVHLPLSLIAVVRNIMTEALASLESAGLGARGIHCDFVGGVEGYAFNDVDFGVGVSFVVEGPALP